MARRRRSVRLVAVLLAVAALLAAAIPTVATATPSASQIAQIATCPKITAQPWQFPGTALKGSRYGSYVVGGYKCDAAATWIQKLSKTTVTKRALGASNVLTNGPAGFVCTANPDANGHAFAGSCRKGKGAKTVGFGWGGRP